MHARRSVNDRTISFWLNPSQIYAKRHVSNKYELLVAEATLIELIPNYTHACMQVGREISEIELWNSDKTQRPRPVFENNGDITVSSNSSDSDLQQPSVSGKLIKFLFKI